MVLVSEAYTSVPEIYSTPLQEKVYQVLQELDMAFQRVETEEVITMEDCQQINERLEMDMVKTLFLCNRQKTNFIYSSPVATSPSNRRNSVRRWKLLGFHLPQQSRWIRC
ncbi:hypothetical protein [Enterococcus avium]|uniref:hypothetical protein n=1 Tax=Enterococcus avium TaxID=33945 RepID=UPI002FE47638